MYLFFVISSILYNNIHLLNNYNKQIINKTTITKGKDHTQQKKAWLNNKNRIVPYKNNLYKYDILNHDYKWYDLYINFNVKKDVIKRDLVDKYGECCKHVQDKFIWDIRLLEKNSHKKQICIIKWNTKYCNFYYELNKSKNINVYNKVKWVIIFLHGAIHEKDNAHLWFDNHNFGGNFNRLKNLSFLNNYIYLSIDFHDFNYIWPIQLSKLINKYKQKYWEKIPFIIIAWSSDGELLSNYLVDYYNKDNTNLKKVVLEGSILQQVGKILNKINHQTKFYIIHGEKDPNISYKIMARIISTLKKNKYNLKSILVKG